MRLPHPPRAKGTQDERSFQEKGRGSLGILGTSGRCYQPERPRKGESCTLEGKLQSLAGVLGAIVFGNGRLRCGLIVETRDEAKGVPESVWQMVEKENECVPAHAKIERDMILVAKEEKPFLRAGKGTVARTQRLKEYDSEIEERHRNGT